MFFFWEGLKLNSIKGAVIDILQILNTTTLVKLKFIHAISFASV